MVKRHPVVLVIDDQPIIAELLQAILEEEGYETQLCTLTRQAVEQAERYEPDLIMLDVNMPFINGWQILNELRQKPSTLQTPVIMMTASSDQATHYKDRLEQYQAHIIFKPFNNDAMKGLVKQLAPLAAYN